MRPLAELIPPLLVRWYLRMKGDSGFFGDYPTWQDAAKQADGYDAGAILARVRDSLGKVRDGTAAYERDGVIFDRIEHAYPLLASLLRVAAMEEGRLDVLDFGGSLGSTYFQCRRFLSPVQSLQWSILEQKAFVAVGRAEFQNDQLRFYADLASCLSERSPNVLILSSVLQFLPDVSATVAGLLQHPFRAVIIDRTPMWLAPDPPDRITVQRVPRQIYGVPIRYPARILQRDKLLALFTPRYVVEAEFDALDGEFDANGTRGRHGGFLLMDSRR
jgi:putative methyltransferase (TIGR04325 family)